MKVLSRTVGPFRENSYLVIDEVARDGVVIDPGDDFPEILEMIRSHDITPSAIWLTHAHLDHIGAVSAMRREFKDIPVYLHPLDRPLYDSQEAVARSYDVEFEQPEAPDRDFAHGDIVRVGNLAFDVIHAPGHSPGHVVLRGHGILLGGDVLFVGSIGRTDLPMADPDDMQETLQKIAALPRDTIVHPGHGDSTTIGEELNSNPFLNGIANVKRNAH